MRRSPMMPILVRSTVVMAVAEAIGVIAIDAAHAAGSGMPWEAPLQRILESIKGPVAKVAAVIIIIVTGLSHFAILNGTLASSVDVRARAPAPMGATQERIGDSFVVDGMKYTVMYRRYVRLVLPLRSIGHRGVFAK